MGNSADFGLIRELFYLRVFNKIDTRTSACELLAEQDGKRVQVSGFSMFPQTDQFIRNTARETFIGSELEFKLEILQKRYPARFMEVVVPAARFYKHPVIEKEDMLTEGLYGAILRTYFERDGFVFAQHPDCYVGYVPAEGLQKTTPERYLRWKNGECAVAKRCVSLNGVVLPPSARLIRENGRVQLPTGEWHRLPAKDALTVNPAASAFVQAVERGAESFKDTPYLWGGKTEQGIDCSGFVQTLALHEGIKLPRDASMQAHVGEIVGYLPKAADLLPGDILFFMNDKAHVFHVGFYLGDQKYLHSSGKMNVVRSSLTPGGENYMSRYGRTLVFARRVHV